MSNLKTAAIELEDTRIQDQLSNAIRICTVLYKLLEPYHVFPALTGGTLYKQGLRKDIDIILYKGSNGGELDGKTLLHNHVPQIVNHVTTLEEVLVNNGFRFIADYGRVIKCVYNDTDIDLIMPEALEGTYQEEHE